MRIVFCGSGEFGVPTLRVLAASRHQVAGVVTQPARPAGRGGHERATPISLVARELGLEAHAVEKINQPESIELLRRFAADVLMVVDFGQFIKLPAREAFGVGAFNLHGSLLPALRGAAPVNWAIIRGLRETGVSTFRLVDRMDAGDIFARRAMPLTPDLTAEDLRPRLAELGVEAVMETLDRIEAGQTAGEPQDEGLATLAPKLKKSDGLIDFGHPAGKIRDLIHGTWPWPGGQARYVSAAGKAIEVVIARAAAHEGGAAACAAGRVLDDLTVATGSGRLEIVQIKPAGSRLMAWSAFVNGYRVAPGAGFETPRACSTTPPCA